MQPGALLGWGRGCTHLLGTVLIASPQALLQLIPLTADALQVLLQLPPLPQTRAQSQPPGKAPPHHVSYALHPPPPLFFGTSADGAITLTVAQAQSPGIDADPSLFSTPHVQPTSRPCQSASKVDSTSTSLYLCCHLLGPVTTFF